MRLHWLCTDLNITLAALEVMGERVTYLDDSSDLAEHGFAECSLDDGDACWNILIAANAWAVATDQFVQSKYLDAIGRFRVGTVPRWRSPLV
jgi:hypothetical protein